MTFKDFAWPENPEHYRVDAQRQPVYTTDEDGNAVFSGMGPVKRIITGSGVFAGADAYTKFQALAALLDEATAGTLTHPVWDDCTVFFTGLKLQQEPRINFVAYEFEFQQADSTGAIPK